MRLSPPQLLRLSLALLLLISQAVMATEEPAALDADIQRTLNAIDADLGFMGANPDTINLDGVIGIRSVEGQTGALLARYWTRLPVWLVTRLTDLRNKAAAQAALTVTSVRRRMPVYFANAGHMIAEHFWDTFYPTRPLPLPSGAGGSLRTGHATAATAATATADNLDEKFSDDCIHEFVGKAGQPRCSISQRCWRAIVVPDGLSGYSLTHQLFYLMNGIQANCLANITAMARAQPSSVATDSDGSLAGTFDGLCARVFEKALKLESLGFPVSDRDLFMEQIGMCGLAGFTEVAQWRWLPALLSWQRPSGCYGDFPGEMVAPANFDPTRYGSYRRRRKRAESRMPDGCLSHRTSVALDALMVYVRRLIELRLADTSA